MSIDPTEDIRRARLVEINTEARAAIAAQPADPRAALEAKHGKVWDTAELQAEFDVLGFMAPLIAARRRADGVLGSLEFCHAPRFYFNWVPDR